MADLLTNLTMAAGAAGGGYEIERSLRFNSADTAYLNRTFSNAGNRKTWTWSAWIKRGWLQASSSLQNVFGTIDLSVVNRQGYISIDNDKIEVINFTTSSYNFRLITTPVFRDISAWYHILVALDTTQATASDRLKVYVNGEQITLFSTATYPSQNFDGWLNANTGAGVQMGIGRVAPYNTSQYFDGYMTEMYFIDGQALTPSSFGQTNNNTGVWEPIEYLGTYGTNGFYLNFSDNSSTSALGTDYSGNSNTFTTNNFSVTAGSGNDSLVDTPTRYGTDTGAGGVVRGNYATWNSLINGDSPRNGNLDVTNDTARSTQALLQFDTYWEITSTGGTTTAGTISGTGTTNTTTIATTKTYGFRLTAAGTLDYINITDGGSFTNITTGLTGQQFIYASAASATTASLNAGQRPFAATAPSGFKALVTTNLPNPAIVQGGDYFNTVLYTGTGSSQSITGVGFQPDFVWIKERNAAADHGLYDAVRGVQQQLETNTTTDETTESTGLTAFNTDGFTVGALAQLNTSTDTYVAWNWKESAISKFDIVTYTGNGTARTISHNLGVVPNMIIVKARTTAGTDQGWPVYHSANTAAPETDYLLLNTTAATADLDTVWNDTLPTSSVFSVGTSALVNTNNDTYVAYLFANVPGFSAFGSYTGNADADGPFIYTGFRPAFIMLKRSNSTSNWTILDFKRQGYNVDNDPLFPNLNDGEGTTDLVDILSNGFKLRSTDASVNASTAPYIFAAFSTNPLKFALAR
jgi:hypothetical protein